MRALIVDDSNAMRGILRMMLKHAGFTEVLEASDGQTALEVLRHSGAVDLGLFDWNMPGMNGIDLLHAVRGNHGYDRMRVMMVTAETEMSEVQRALQQGADEYLMKPFSRDIVLDKVRMLGF